MTTPPIDDVTAELYRARCRLLRATVGLSAAQLNELAAAVEHGRAADGDRFMLLPPIERADVQPVSPEPTE